MINLAYEMVARQIHKFYSARHKGFLPTTYDGLPEFMKADNLAAARRIDAVLAIAGLFIDGQLNNDWPVEDQDQIRAIIEENIPYMAEAEHDGWQEARLRHGWTLGPHPADAAAKKDNFNRRVHHLLIPYAKLPKEEQTKDEDVRNYVTIIDNAKYRIIVKQKLQPKLFKS